MTLPHFLPPARVRVPSEKRHRDRSLSGRLISARALVAHLRDRVREREREIERMRADRVVDRERIVEATARIEWLTARLREHVEAGRS